MKVLFATSNPAKVKCYVTELKNRGIEVLLLKDLDLNLDVDENGSSAAENASIKARAYFDAAHITTIAIDDNLYIDGISDEKQPKTHVRRVNGVTLNDEQMIGYYTNLVKSLGGKANGRWIKGIAICSQCGIKTFEHSRGGYYLVDKPSKEIHEGYPLDSIAIIPEFNKYLSELNPEELKKYKENNSFEEVFEFILNNIE